MGQSKTIDQNMDASKQQKAKKKINLNVICQRGVNDIRAQLHIQRTRGKWAHFFGFIFSLLVLFW